MITKLSATGVEIIPWSTGRTPTHIKLLKRRAERAATSVQASASGAEVVPVGVEWSLEAELAKLGIEPDGGEGFCSTPGTKGEKQKTKKNKAGKKKKKR